MDNSITQYAIGELLDGRYLYIPSYQRGYRWTEKQVGDLLRDLLCFAYDAKADSDFYCLQPIIARRITDEHRIGEIFRTDSIDERIEKGVWEIIDGQQRLTTIYLLYKYLMAKKNWDEDTLKEEENGKELYHIIYATREESESFLNSLSLSMIGNDEPYAGNIDFYHMASAFRYIEKWI